MSTEDQSRSEFEAHMRSQKATTSFSRYVTDPPDYKTQSVDAGWKIWQESRRTYRASVLEEAAKLCEDGWHLLTRHECAAAIRALATQTPPCRGTACGTTTGEG